jgi:hypothetical protein
MKVKATSDILLQEDNMEAMRAEEILKLNNLLTDQNEMSTNQ